MNIVALKNILFRCFSLSVFILFVSNSLHAQNASDDDRAAFNEVYQEYQQIVAGNGDASRLSEVAAEVYRLGETVFGPEHPNTAALSLNYARTLSGTEALEALDESLEIFEDVFGDDAVDLVDPYMELAQTHAGLGNREEAKTNYLNALELVEEHLESGSQLEGLIKMSVGVIDTGATVSTNEQARHEEQTKDYLQSAREIFANLEDPQSNLYRAQTEYAMGNFEIRLGNFEDALDPLLDALDTFSGVSPSDEITINTHRSIITAYERLNRPDDATLHCLAISEVVPYDPDNYQPVYSINPNPSASSRGGPLSRIGRGAEGFTVVSFTVDSEGFVVDPEVVESEGSSLFPPESLRTIREFRYAPRLVDGEPVDTPNVTFRFEFSPPSERAFGRGR